MRRYKIERPKKEPEAAVIYFPNDRMPAYIPSISEYTYDALVELVACANEAVENGESQPE